MSTLIRTTHPATRTRQPRTGFWKMVGWMGLLRRQRRDLANLDPHLLKDIGLTRAAAAREARRKPWDAPENWHF